MVQDKWTAEQKEMPAVEMVPLEEPVFDSGPVTRRVAVIDFDPASGLLRDGAKFRPPNANQPGTYVCSKDPNDVAFNQVSVFGAVLQTMYMFEEEDTLGRPTTWAFGAPQLLVVPRAGEWANAYYERSSHSLQFFYFRPPRFPGLTVYSNLSHDIISHETGHAILDGIAPDLYDASAPQSLALHESVADLTALIMSFRSDTLRKVVLDKTRGSIAQSTAFSTIAEEFGADMDPTGRSGYLRNLDNSKTLESVPRDRPHELSEVLSGALYKIMVRLHNIITERIAKQTGQTQFSASGKGLVVAGEQLKRMAFRALDYLPPGEVSFADYGRAILAADQASHEEAEDVRKWIRDEFVERGIAPSRGALEVTTNYHDDAVNALDLAALVSSDRIAHEFASEHPDALGIPEDADFEVRRRLDVTKLYYHRENGKRATTKVRECLFKVSWSREESNDLGAPFPDTRRVAAGSTLAIDWKEKVIRARLTTGNSNRGEEDRQRQERGAFLRWLLDRERLDLREWTLGPDGRVRSSVVPVETAGGVMQVHGTARMLHIAGGRTDE